jgi:hypothetical protein
MFKKRWLEREKLRAVHNDDLEEFLSSIGVLDEVRKGCKHCMVCDTRITIANLGAVYPRDEKINFVCDNLSCLSKLNISKEDINA